LEIEEQNIDLKEEYELPNTPGYVLLNNLGICVLVISPKEGENSFDKIKNNFTTLFNF